MALPRRLHIFIVLLHFAFALFGANGEYYKMVTTVGSAITFNCSTRTSKRMCSLNAMDATVASDDPDVKVDDRFKIIDLTNCIVEATNLQWEDSTNYSCYSSQPRFDLLVGVKPTDPKLTQNKAELKNGTDVLLTDTLLKADISCETRDGIPNATFDWYIDGNRTTDSVSQAYEDSTRTLKSILKSPFNEYDEKTKVIACHINHPLYLDQPVVVSARFGVPVATSWANLEIDSKQPMVPDDERVLRCTADGMPAASEFQIEKLDETETPESWKILIKNATAIIREAGSYRCLARNVYKTLKDNSFETSPKVSITKTAKPTDTKENGGDNNVNHDVTDHKPSTKDSSPNESMPVTTIVAIVCGITIAVIIVIAIIAILQRNQRACFRQRSV